MVLSMAAFQTVAPSTVPPKGQQACDCHRG